MSGPVNIQRRSQAGAVGLPPPAPWTLCGRSTQALHLIDVHVARSYVPEALDIVAVLPGKTLGGIYCATYGRGSVLQYDELLVVPALVRFGTRRGFWVSHIYVDDVDSMRGGRETWGLPKQLAQFERTTTEDEGTMRVSLDGQPLCSVRFHYGRARWPFVLRMPVLSRRGDEVLWTRSRITGRLHVGRAQVGVPAESPFAGLLAHGPLAAAPMDHLSLTVQAPEVVGRYPR
jgi:acetoacetate decarboxylase